MSSDDKTMDKKMCEWGLKGVKMIWRKKLEQPNKKKIWQNSIT